MLASLAVEPGHRLLEIGTGTGFTAAVMARMGARVKTVERYRTLVEAASRRFATLGFGGISIRQADGARGLAGEGRSTASSSGRRSSLPRHFVDQLASSGVMIAAIGPGDQPQSWYGWCASAAGSNGRGWVKSVCSHSPAALRNSCERQATRSRARTVPFKQETL